MVDKLQKAGAWLWYNKERMVLVIMLGPVVEKLVARRERGGRDDPDRPL